jgi:hypothetical protein
VNPLGLSSEQVTRYQELFLNAISWYETSLTEDKRNERYVRDAGYSLIPHLKAKVESGEYLSSGKEIVLLEVILNEYLPHLRELEKKPWIKEETIAALLDQLTEITRDGLLKVKQ